MLPSPSNISLKHSKNEAAVAGRTFTGETVGIVRQEMRIGVWISKDLQVDFKININIDLK